ncbi:MAG: hypothetical protein NTZ20_05065 [Candidatus Levybacteria bacterium]|nr:hypothetical protein [Candidatus Levybacteria bacterium]
MRHKQFMTSAEYFLQGKLPYDEVASYLNYVNGLSRGSLEAGFIKWDDEEACVWGGPWPGNMVFASIEDGRTQYNELPDDSKYGDVYTSKKPIRIYLAGTDDTTYTLMVRDANTAYEIIDRVIANPTMENIYNLGFVFSN